MTRYPYLLFDADNTLFDFDEANVSSFRAVCAYAGLAFTPELFACFDRRNNAAWARFDRGELTKDEAMAWMYNMHNEDGSMGAHWDVEQTRPYMEPRGISCEVWKWAAVMNMMYSDYCKAARKNSVDRPEFYADLAAAFLDDRDAPEDKAGRYYHMIASKIHN